MIKIIEGTVVSNSSAVVSFDITDYYPTPSHPNLVDTAGRAFASQEQNDAAKIEAFKNLTTLILREQYVQTQVGKRTYRCNTGSAIGMRASGGLCDSHLAEREASLLFTRMVVAKDTIGDGSLYRRFKDDGLIFIEGTDTQIIELFRGWNRISEWRIDKITICRQGTRTASSEKFRLDDRMFEVERNCRVTYLDLEMWFGERWQRCGRLDLRTFCKPTSIKTPLSFDSAHRENCKAWWPLAEARRFARSCGTMAHWRQQTENLLLKIPDYPLDVRRRLQDPSIYWRRAALVNGRARRGCVFGQTNSLRLRDKRTCVLKLRSDKACERVQFEKILRRNAYHLKALSDAVDLRVSWLNHCKHMRLALRLTWPK